MNETIMTLVSQKHSPKKDSPKEKHPFEHKVRIEPKPPGDHIETILPHGRSP